MVPLREYRHLNLKRAEDARRRRESFKSQILNLMKERETFRLKISDEEAAGLIGVSVRSVQRIISHFKKTGVWEVERIRHRHHEFGWCNKRMLVLSPEYRIILTHKRERDK